MFFLDGQGPSRLNGRPVKLIQMEFLFTKRAHHPPRQRLFFDLIIEIKFTCRFFCDMEHSPAGHVFIGKLCFQQTVLLFIVFHF